MLFGSRRRRRERAQEAEEAEQVNRRLAQTRERAKWIELDRQHRLKAYEDMMTPEYLEHLHAWLQSTSHQPGTPPWEEDE